MSETREKQYLEELGKWYDDYKDINSEVISRLEFTCDYIFDITTYDSELSELFCKNMLEVVESILNRSTFEYIKDESKYLNYITMVNMPFLQDKLDWGTSIRGAWFDKVNMYGKTIYKFVVGQLEVPGNEIEDFIKALIIFNK